MFPSAHSADALAELRQLAFDALDKREPVHSGAVALIMRAHLQHLLAERIDTAWPEQLYYLAHDFQLGEDGPNSVADYMVQAWKAVESRPRAEHPWVRHVLDYLLPPKKEPKEVSCPSYGLAIVRDAILREPAAIWAYPGREQLGTVGLSPQAFPPGKYDEAIAELRQLALRACEDPDRFCVGAVALVVEEFLRGLDVARFWKQEMKLLARDFVLCGEEDEDARGEGGEGGKGKNGVELLKDFMERSRQELDGQKGEEYPWVRYFVVERPLELPQAQAASQPPRELRPEEKEEIQRLLADVSQLELEWPPLPPAPPSTG